MSFEFNCRTSDNVELVLEGTFFWEVVDIPKMLRFTSDAPGDVCAHARSSFIALVSKVTLREFMEHFNERGARVGRPSTGAARRLFTQHTTTQAREAGVPGRRRLLPQ